MADADLSFIPDLPSNGPLEVYRKHASFNWKQLKALFDDLELLKLKYKIWQILEADPLFAHTLATPSVDEERRIVSQQIKRIQQYQFVTEDIMKANYKKKTRHLMTVNEAIQAWNANVSVKMAIGIHLFTNTILALGTEKHLPIYEDAWTGKILSCCALTEVAHGSDTKSMRTTATYDADTDEFVLNTPDFQAAKCWVGNLGKTCTMGLVFAQLVVNGVQHGLHVFVVQLRDPKTLLPPPGVLLGDMGEKVGLNGIDNGFVVFRSYRIPHSALLNRTRDVCRTREKGSWTAEVCDGEGGWRAGSWLETLSAGRVGIMQESCGTLAAAATISTRYAAARMQFNNTPILMYPLHQHRIFPYVAAAAVLKVFVATFTNVYLETVELSNNNDIPEDMGDKIAEIHALVSSIKPLVTWTAMHSIQEAREACGGHGYLKAARLGELRNNHDPTVTYEGDNHVLGQQTTNWLLRHLNDPASPLESLAFLVKESIETVLQRHYRHGASLHSIQFILHTYEWLITYLTVEVQKQTTADISSGLCRTKALQRAQVHRAVPLTRVFAEYNAVRWFAIRMNTAEKELRPVMERLVILYGLWSLEKHLGTLYEGGYGVDGSLARDIRLAARDACSHLQPDVISVVDALAPPDFILNSVLGRADGKLYDNLEQALFRSPGALERASWWKELVRVPLSKL